MKNILLITSFFVLFWGCKKESTSTTTSTTTIASSKLSATVNGASWNSDLHVTAFSYDGLISIKGYKAATDCISLDFEVSAPGTYNWGDDAKTIMGSYLKPTNVGYHAKDGSGTLVVSELTSSTVKGSFSFTGQNLLDTTDIIEVKNGKFEVKYLKQQ